MQGFSSLPISSDTLSHLILWEQGMQSEPKLPEIMAYLTWLIQEMWWVFLLVVVVVGVFFLSIIATLPQRTIVEAQAIVKMKHTSRHQCFVKQNKTEINLKMGWESSQLQDLYVTKDLSIRTGVDSQLLFRSRTQSSHRVVATRTRWIIDKQNQNINIQRSIFVFNFFLCQW